MPPALATGSLWNAWGFEKLLSKRTPLKKNFEYFEIKRVVKKLIIEKIIKKL